VIREIYQILIALSKKSAIPQPLDIYRSINAVAESFFATLKTEIGTQVRATRDDARRAVFAYLGYYNHDRLHSTLGCRTPYGTRISYRQDIANPA
jgi:transposase InsO family protein